MAEVGLYFGSFNPIHIGHIAIAGYITEFTGTDQVWFVVSPHNPLKNKETLLDDYQRLHMVRLAIGDNDKLKACDIEFRLPVPSYTIDTLAHLTEKHPGHRFSLIMGEDNLYTFHKWKNAEELVSRHPIYVYPRRGSVKPDSPLLEKLLTIGEIHYVNAPVIELSGTFIRNGIRKGRDMSYYLTPAVWKYIDEMNFYRK
jgi:nicotinate-nucleotide adenylyltransferase